MHDVSDLFVVSARVAVLGLADDTCAGVMLKLLGRFARGVQYGGSGEKCKER